jgi:hypothetical protein
VKVLREAGAHFIAEHSVSESCSGDGLVAVSMDARDTDLHADVSTVRARDTLYGELEWDLAAVYPLRYLHPKVLLDAAKGTIGRVTTRR